MAKDRARSRSRSCSAPPKVRPVTDAQEEYMNAIQNRIVTFGIGSAGTGKSYIATVMACDALLSGETSTVVVTRPVVEAGNSLGALPGELEDKYQPYIEPVYQAMLGRMGSGQLSSALKTGRIRPIPLEFMRGMTFDNSWVILDEAQNVTPKQMKMFLTRIGMDCKVIITGDPDQCDLREASGLLDAVRRIETLPDVDVVEFTADDSVRSGIVQDILNRY